LAAAVADSDEAITVVADKVAAMMACHALGQQLREDGKCHSVTSLPLNLEVWQLPCSSMKFDKRDRPCCDLCGHHHLWAPPLVATIGTRRNPGCRWVNCGMLCWLGQ